VAYYGIVSNKNLGFGHLDRYFEDYKDVLIKHGFKLSGMNEKDKTNIYRGLLASPGSDLPKLAAVFNALVKEASEVKTGTTGIKTPAGISTKPDAAYIPFTSQPVSFSDIEDYPWAAEAIAALAQSGAIKGKDKDIFAPGDKITREEFVKIIASVLDLDISDTNNSFTDVSSDWSIPYITAAVKAGIVKGVDKSLFAPEDLISREQGAVIIFRALIYLNEQPQSDETLFDDDADISEWAKEAVYCLKNIGIIDGKGANKFVPLDYLSRAEAAKIIFGINKVHSII